MSEDQAGLIAVELTKVVAAIGGRVIDEESLLAMYGQFYNGVRDVSLERVEQERRAALRDFRSDED